MARGSLVLGHSVSEWLSCRSKLAQLVSDHLFRDHEWNVVLAIVYMKSETAVDPSAKRGFSRGSWPSCTCKTYPTKFGKMVQLRALVLMAVLFL